MKGKRKIIVYIATSADGYIARPDGSVDWLNRPRPVDNYGMGTFYKSIDTILWGRKTYEAALGFGGQPEAPGSASRRSRTTSSRAGRRSRPRPAWNLSVSQSPRSQSDFASRRGSTSG